MYPTYTRQGLTSIVGAAGARQILNGLNEQINVQTFGASGRLDDDDSPKIQAAFDYAATITGRQKVIVIPEGDYLVQDPTAGSHLAESDGALWIGPNASDITIWGYGARLVLGPNGVSRSLLRIFGSRIKVLGLEIDMNGRIPAFKSNVAVQIAGTHSDSVEGVSGSDCLVRDCYIHGSRFRDEYTTGTIEYDHAGNAAGSRVVILTGGPAWPTDAATNGRIKISGSWYTVSAYISSTILQLSSSSNPGSDVAAGTSYIFRHEPLMSGGADGIQVLGGYRNRIHHNWLEDIGWSAIRCSGGDNEVMYNTVKNQRANGVRILEHTGTVKISFNNIESLYCSGRSCIIVDPGSDDDDDSPLTNNDKRAERVVLRDNTCRCLSDGDMEGAGSALKLAAIRSCLVDGGEYYAGTDINNLAVRLEDSLTRIEFRGDCRIIGEFNQAPVFVGEVTATTSLSAGARMQLTIASHGLVTGKSLYITNSGIARLNREFIVTEVIDANNVVIGYVNDEDGTVVERTYIAGSITNTQAHAGTHELILRNCIIQRGTHDTNYNIRGVFSPIFDMEGCLIEMVEPKSAMVKEAGLNCAYYSDLGIQRFRAVNNQFLFNSDKLCKCIICDGDNSASSASTKFLTAGKFICYANRMGNKNTGTVLLVNIYESGDSVASYDDRLIIFSTVGEDARTFWSAATPTESVVTFADGDMIRNTAPASAGAPAWVCTTPGKSGTFSAMANLA